MIVERFRVPLDLRAEDGADEAKGVITGYGSVFGNLNSYGEVVVKGAFKDTLRDWKKRGQLPPMLLQHGGLDITAEDMVPIGVWTEMAEDDHGLKVTGELLAPETDLGRRVYAALKRRAMTGLSIGFIAKEFTVGTKPEEPRRTIRKIDLWEVSLVTFPADDLARAETRALPTDREIERWLMREAGLSRKEAQIAIASGFRAVRARRDAGEQGDAAGLAEIAEAIRRNTAAFTRNP